jgi:hypothetical protein
MMTEICRKATYYKAVNIGSIAKLLRKSHIGTNEALGSVQELMLV